MSDRGHDARAKVAMDVLRRTMNPVERGFLERREAKQPVRVRAWDPDVFRRSVHQSGFDPCSCGHEGEE